jgi:hypothetical protein
MTCPCGSGLIARRGNVGQLHCDACIGWRGTSTKLRRTVVEDDASVIRRQAVARRRIEEIRDEKGEG